MPSLKKRRKNEKRTEEDEKGPPTKSVALSPNTEKMAKPVVSSRYFRRRAGFDFFNIDTVTLAKKLLGQILVSKMGPSSERLAGVIVETEAYPGGTDEASHSFDGKRTNKNEALFQPPGTFYVYFCYGRLSLCNISSNETGAGVLIRALEPSEGLATMCKNRGGATVLNEVEKTGKKIDKNLLNLCNGPAKLSQALGLSRDNANMLSLVDCDKVFLEINNDLAPIDIFETKRIGIDYAGKEWQDKLWRFYVRDSKFISKK